MEHQTQGQQQQQLAHTRRELTTLAALAARSAAVARGCHRLQAGAARERRQQWAPHEAPHCSCTCALQAAAAADDDAAHCSCTCALQATSRGWQGGMVQRDRGAAHLCRARALWLRAGPGPALHTLGSARSPGRGRDGTSGRAAVHQRGRGRHARRCARGGAEGWWHGRDTGRQAADPAPREQLWPAACRAAEKAVAAELRAAAKRGEVLPSPKLTVHRSSPSCSVTSQVCSWSTASIRAAGAGKPAKRHCGWLVDGAVVATAWWRARQRGSWPGRDRRG